MPALPLLLPSPEQRVLLRCPPTPPSALETPRLLVRFCCRGPLSSFSFPLCCWEFSPSILDSSPPSSRAHCRSLPLLLRARAARPLSFLSPKWVCMSRLLFSPPLLYSRMIPAGYVNIYAVLIINSLIWCEYLSYLFGLTIDKCNLWSYKSAYKPEHES